jgi:DNA-binding response OmpR family regulator
VSAQSPASVTGPVAVVDDDVQYIRLVERILATEHISVMPITTLDVDEAVSVISDSGCSAAVVDVYMYGDTLGFSLVERLRERFTADALPIIIASGAPREVGRHVDFLRDSGCSVLLKPFEPDDLLARLLAPACGADAVAAQAERRPARRPGRRHHLIPFRHHSNAFQGGEL